MLLACRGTPVLYQVPDARKLFGLLYVVELCSLWVNILHPTAVLLLSVAAKNQASMYAAVTINMNISTYPYCAAVLLEVL